MKTIFFDTETNGLPFRGAHWEADFDKFPRIASIAWRLMDGEDIMSEHSFFIKPCEWTMPEEASKINGLTTESLLSIGHIIKPVLQLFLTDAGRAERIVGHNVYFDTSIVKSELLRLKAIPEKFQPILSKEKRYCTMRKSTGIISDKWPKLGEIYKHFFNEELEGAHSALNDLTACQRVYEELIKRGIN